MEAAIKKATNVDQVVQLHRGFLSHALSALLLSQPRITRLVWSICQLAQGFCKAVNTDLERLAGWQPSPSGRSVGGDAPSSGSQQRGQKQPQPLDTTHDMSGVSSLFNANLSNLVLELQAM